MKVHYMCSLKGTHSYKKQAHTAVVCVCVCMCVRGMKDV